MTDKLFTEDEQKRYEAKARRRGFKTLRDYMRSLIERDVEQDDDALEGFRIAWGQAMRGELLTEEEFWKAVGDDE